MSRRSFWGLDRGKSALEGTIASMNSGTRQHSPQFYYDQAELQQQPVKKPGMTRRTAIKVAGGLGLAGLIALFAPGFVGEAFAAVPADYAMDDKEARVLSQPEVKEYFLSRQKAYLNWPFLRYRKNTYDVNFSGFTNIQTGKYDPSKFDLKEFRSVIDNYREYDDIMPLLKQMFDLVEIPNVRGNRRAAKAELWKSVKSLRAKDYKSMKMHTEKALKLDPAWRVSQAYNAEADGYLGDLYDALAGSIRAIKIDQDDDNRGFTTDAFCTLSMVFFASAVQETYLAGLNESLNKKKDFSVAQHYFRLWDIAKKKQISVEEHAGRCTVQSTKAYGTARKRISDCSKYFGVYLL